VERHITLPYMTLGPDFGVSVFGVGKNDPQVWLTSGIEWGITDRIEVELTANSFRFSPDAAYAEPSFGATFLFLKTAVEMAGRARFFVPIDSANMDNGIPLLGLSLPVWFHLGKIVRLETGATVSLNFQNGDVRGGLAELDPSPILEDPGIPVKFVFQPLQPLFLGVSTGLEIGDFKAAAETTYIPIGAQIGITTESNNQPSADFGVRFDLPHFIAPSLEDKIREDTYQVAGWLRWYYYL